MPKRIRLISPQNPEIEYFELLSNINAKVIDEKQMIFYDRGLYKLSEKCLWIRHDVDHDLNKALTMARAEAENNYPAIYLFLHSAPYFHKRSLNHAVKEIHSLGHAIGLHNNAVAEWYKRIELGEKSPPQPITYIMNAKDRLEQIIGKPIIFTSAHGDRICREKDFLNYDMWFENPYPPKAISLTKSKESMMCVTKSFSSIREAGLAETYFVRRDAYLTDSGHKWQGWIKEDIPRFEWPEQAPAMDAMMTVTSFNFFPEGIMQLLIHPFWWEGEK